MGGTIKDKIAVVGMGCSKFGENWDKGKADMIREATYEALEDAKITLQDIDAVWVGSQNDIGAANIVAEALMLHDKPISRCENWCTTGQEAFRNASFAVAAGIYDTVLVVGYEKLKDTGSRGLPALDIYRGGHPIYMNGCSAVTVFALAAVKYFKEYGATKETLAKVAVKNHYNGSLTPKAHLRKAVTLEQAYKSPIVSWPLGVMDCCGVSDGCAAAIITRADAAKNFRDDYVLVKGFGLAIMAMAPQFRPDFDYSSFTCNEAAGREAYEMAGIKDPRKELSCAEVHDCFTIAELYNYEDLGFCKRGEAWKLIEEGVTDLKGPFPVNMDGGLKSFGHPVGATGVRMIYEIYKQMQGKCGERQVPNPKLGLVHDIGGWPSASGVTILGTRD